MKGQLLGRELKFLLDAGASLSILNQRIGKGKTQSFDEKRKQMCDAVASNNLRQKPEQVSYGLWSQRKTL